MLKFLLEHSSKTLTHDQEWTSNYFSHLSTKSVNKPTIMGKIRFVFFFDHYFWEVISRKTTNPSVLILEFKMWRSVASKIHNFLPWGCSSYLIGSVKGFSEVADKLLLNTFFNKSTPSCHFWHPRGVFGL